MEQRIHGTETIFAMLTLCLMCILLVSVSRADAAERPENVILIYADDLGIGMLGCYGQQLVKTPNIDQLAAEGMKFNNYYGGVFCAPTRWTLMTGMHDGRIGGWKQTRAGLAIQRDAGRISEAEYEKRFKQVKAHSLPIPPEEVFLAQVAKTAGYETAQFGKLDRGFLTWNERVRRFGWDFHEGYYDHVRAHGFYPSYLWRNGSQFKLDGNDDPFCGKAKEAGTRPVGSGGKTYSQNVFIQDILTYIRQHKNKPFFLYHPTQLPHGPVAIPELHPDYANDERLTLTEKKYASMVRMLDDHVGLIMQELKDLGLDEKTAVFFSSDNGHELYYGPKKAYADQKLADGKSANLTDRKWRTSECGDVFDGAGGRAGLKRSAYQGGMQCPLIVRWPGHVAENSETDILSAHYDFMATLADLGGVEMPAGKDSVSYLPTLLGQPQVTKHDYVFVNNQFNKMGRTALITGDGWKLVEVDRKKDQFQLYQIAEDNEERFELSAKYPEKLSLLKSIWRDQVDSARPDLSVTTN